MGVGGRKSATPTVPSSSCMKNVFYHSETCANELRRFRRFWCFLAQRLLRCRLQVVLLVLVEARCALQHVAQMKTALMVVMSQPGDH